MIDYAPASKWAHSFPNRLNEWRNHDPSIGLSLRSRYGNDSTLIPYAAMPGIVAAYAAFLRAQGIDRGSRVIIPFETRADIIFSFFAMLAIGVVPFSVKPCPGGSLRASYAATLANIANRHGVMAILDTPSLQGVDIPLRRIPLLPFDTTLQNTPELSIDIKPDDIAFVQFTSGSTSAPKGIPILHGSLVAQFDILASTYVGDSLRGSSWLPLFHDMGLIAGLLSRVYSGSPLDLGTPQGFLMSPIGWLELLSQKRIEITIVPNFAIEYCLRALRDEDPSELAALNLEALKTIFVGSEPINIDALRDFSTLLAPYGFRPIALKPSYGMAEAVLMVSCTGRDEHYRVVERSGSTRSISVGKPHVSYEVRIRDDRGIMCAEGEAGEIEIRGGTITSGYLEDDYALLDAEGFYHTGDIGFLDAGELFILGRTGERFKINAQTFFAADFEHALLKVPITRPGCVAVIQTGGRIVGLIEHGRRSTSSHLSAMQLAATEHIFQSLGVKVLPEDVLFVMPGQLARTSSGKMQRNAITKAFDDGLLRFLVPKDE